MATKTLYEKIQAIASEIKGLEKDISVGSGNYGYKAISDESVILAVKDAEAKHGVVSIPYKQELVKSEVVQSPPNDNGAVKLTYIDTIKMTTKIINIESPTDFIEIESFGRGVDPSDKGLGKASTYARKYALLNAYKIATGVDPDRFKSESVDVQAKEDVKRLQVVNYLLLNDKFRESTFQHFGLIGIEELAENHINTLYGNLIKRGEL